MKIIIAVLLLCATHASSLQTCDEVKWMANLRACFEQSSLGGFFAAMGIQQLDDLCNGVEIRSFGSCMVNVTSTCHSDWYDMERMKMAYDKLCRNPVSCPQIIDTAGPCVENCKDTSECMGNKICCSNGCGHDCAAPVYRNPECNIDDGGLSTCMHEMRESWELNKGMQPQDTIYCHLYGGIKKCIYTHMSEKCKNRDIYKDLLETFTPWSCAGQWECGFCDRGPITSASPLITASLASVVGALFLYKML